MDQQFTDFVIQTLNKILASLHVEATIEVEESITKGLIFNILSRDSFMLIGRQGAHLHALELVVKGIVYKRFSGIQALPFTVDVDDYRRKREWYLKETAKQAIERVRRIGKPVTLEPMPAYERKLVHAYLQEQFPEAVTHSIGQEPHRRIVVNLKKDPA
jgi:spoIIIJ-associated protein